MLRSGPYSRSVGQTGERRCGEVARTSDPDDEEDPIMSHTPPATHVAHRGEAARQLGLSRATLERWRHDRRGPAFARFGSDGRAIRYSTADLDAWSAARRVEPTTEA